MSFITKSEWDAFILTNYQPGKSWADICEESDDEDEKVSLETIDDKKIDKEWIEVKKKVKTPNFSTKKTTPDKKVCYFYSIGKCHFGKNCINIHQ